MKHELRRVDPLRAANVGATVYALLTAAFALILAPFFLLVSLFGAGQDAPFAGPAFALLLLFLYPIMGAVVGWLSGLLTSAIYNFVVRWTGGVLFELEAAPPPA